MSRYIQIYSAYVLHDTLLNKGLSELYNYKLNPLVLACLKVMALAPLAYSAWCWLALGLSRAESWTYIRLLLTTELHYFGILLSEYRHQQDLLS